MKKILALILALAMAFSLCGCGSNAEIEERLSELEAKNEELLTEVDALRQENEVLKQATTENSPKANASNEEIPVECPDVIISNGWHIKVLDAYVKCQNTQSSYYDYDGMFLFFRGEIVSVDANADDWISVLFDYYDADGRYAGGTQVAYESGLSTDSIGRTVSGNGLLCVYDASKAAYNGECEGVTETTNASNSSITSTPTPSSNSSKPNSGVKSKYSTSDVADVAKQILDSEEILKNCYEIQTSEDSVIVWLTFDGMAETMTREQLNGSTKTHDSMDKSTKDLCTILCNSAALFELDDCSIMVALLNDVNTENTLIAYIDGMKVSDYLD